MKKSGSPGREETKQQFDLVHVVEQGGKRVALGTLRQSPMTIRV